MENGKPFEALALHAVVAGIGVDPGWVFCPTDEQLISVYLRSKNEDPFFVYPMIPLLDINGICPRVLVGHGIGFFFGTSLSTSDKCIKGSIVAVKDTSGVVIGFKQKSKFQDHCGNEHNDAQWALCDYWEGGKEVSGFVITKVCRKGKSVREVALNSSYFCAVKNSLFLNPALPTLKYGPDVDIGLDPGWFFAPCDKDLLSLFLRSKLQDDGYTYPTIPDIDVYASNPAVLVGEGDGYFFNLRKPSSVGGNKADRVSVGGRWMNTCGKESITDDSGNSIGLKRCLKFIPSDGKKEDVSSGSKECWLMNEYQILEEQFCEMVLSKVYYKGKKKAFQMQHHTKYMSAVKVAMHLYPDPPIHPSEHALEHAAVEANLALEVGPVEAPLLPNPELMWKQPSDVPYPLLQVDVDHEEENISAVLELQFTWEDYSLRGLFQEIE